MQTDRPCPRSGDPANTNAVTARCPGCGKHVQVTSLGMLAEHRPPPYRTVTQNVNRLHAAGVTFKGDGEVRCLVCGTELDPESADEMREGLCDEDVYRDPREMVERQGGKPCVHWPS